MVECIKVSKRAEKSNTHLKRMVSVLKAVRRVNHIITHEKESAPLLQSICDCLTQTGEYYNTWIVLFDGQRNLLACYESGLGKIFSPMADRLRAGKFSRCCRESFLHNRVIITDNPERICSDCPLSCYYYGRGSLSIRLEHNGHTFGMLSASVPLEYLTNSEEISLFNEMANDISLALHTLKIERERTEYHERIELANKIIESSKAVLFRWSNAEGWPVEYVSENISTFGYNPEDLMSTSFNFESIIHPDDILRVSSEVSSTVRNRETELIQEYRILKKSGEYRWIEAQTTIEYDEAGAATAFKGILIDITKQKEMQERLYQTEKMDAIGQLAGGVAHDFNNQLSGILGYAEMLESRLDDPDLKQFAVSISNAAKLSGDLTRKLLTFSRKGPFRKETVDIHTLIQESINILSHTINKNICISQKLNATESTTIGDPSLIENAFLNLAVNARDAMPDGGSLRFTTKVVNLKTPPDDSHGFDLEAGRYIMIAISDSGSGIPQEIIKHIFEPFYTTKKEGKGTGMGLASVFGTIKQHKGAITVKSKTGKGSSFNIYLPLNACTLTDNKQDNQSSVCSRSLRILVVDDEDFIRELEIQMLSEEGHTVLSASDGHEATRIYSEKWKEIDLVIMDMIMPKMSGRETFFALKQINPDIKAIIMSGFSLNDDSEAVMKNGAAGFLQKPFDRNKLIETIDSIFS